MSKLLTGVLNPQEVQFYSHHARDLLQTQRNKILHFIEFHCIEYIGDNIFICKPIPNYNKRTYTLIKMANGEFSCNCQYYVMKRRKGEELFCSHLGALYEFFSMGRKYE